MYIFNLIYTFYGGNGYDKKKEISFKNISQQQKTRKIIALTKTVVLEISEKMPNIESEKR